MPFHKSAFSGFPFDDDREEQDAPFRSQLDDIAARHPEFAQHLGSLPFRSGSRTRSQIPEQFTQRFADRPFGDRFERFGFPFDEEFKEEDQKPYYQRYPKYYPQQKSEERTGEQSSDCSESQGTNSEAKEATTPQEAERSRRPKNIQPSNTVDLGQRQEPVDDRNQRSMSAPPPNSRPRFVSSINIPINQTTDKPNVAQHATQASAPPQQPQERVIPIHVEGRDEPVIPKKTASQTSSQPHPQSQQYYQQQSQPYSDKFYTQRSPNFSQYFNRDQPFTNEWLPRGFGGRQSQPQQEYNQGQRGRSPQPQPKPDPAQQPQNTSRQAETPQQKPQQQYQQPTSKAETEEPKPQEPQKAQSNRSDPIDQIKSIQKDVSELMTQVDQFSGKPRDKQYLYLDEMLTRNLIKLDNIDTQGLENIRLARKEAIKCIEKCISILESKANANAENQPKENVMEVENSEKNVEESENTVQEPQNKEQEVEQLTAVLVGEINKCVEPANVAAVEKMEVETVVAESPAENIENSETKVESMNTDVPQAETLQKESGTSEMNQETQQIENSIENKKEKKTKKKAGK